MPISNPKSSTAAIYFDQSSPAVEIYSATTTGVVLGANQTIPIGIVNGDMKLQTIHGHSIHGHYAMDVFPHDQMLHIPAGDIAGHTTVNKFGANLNIPVGSEVEVWDEGEVYYFPTTTEITNIYQVADQVAMRGETIEVQGLDTNWDLTVQNVNLDITNTTTTVVLPTPLLRVFRMKALSAVSTNSTIKIINDAATRVFAAMQAGNNQTLMALYTVPNGKTAYMTSYYYDYVKEAARDPDSVEFSLWGADRVAGYTFQLKHKVGLPKGGAGQQHEFRPYYKFTQKTDILMRAKSYAFIAHVHAGFDLIVIDN